MKKLISAVLILVNKDSAKIIPQVKSYITNYFGVKNLSEDNDDDPNVPVILFKENTIFDSDKKILDKYVSSFDECFGLIIIDDFDAENIDNGNGSVLTVKIP